MKINRKPISAWGSLSKNLAQKGVLSGFISSVGSLTLDHYI